MNNLHFAQRGPFKVSHLSAVFYLFVVHAAPVLPLGRQSYCVGIDFGVNKYRTKSIQCYWPSSVRWYRKPSLADRGPFSITGWCPPHKPSPRTCSFCLPIRYLKFFLGRPFYPEGKTLTGISWIYYSGNISNATTCH
jgi:hypothetical protein